MMKFIALLALAVSPLLLTSCDDDRYYGRSYGRGYYGPGYYGGSRVVVQRSYPRSYYGRSYYGRSYYGSPYGRSYYGRSYSRPSVVVQPGYRRGYYY